MADHLRVASVTSKRGTLGAAAPVRQTCRCAAARVPPEHERAAAWQRLVDLVARVLEPLALSAVTRRRSRPPSPPGDDRSAPRRTGRSGRAAATRRTLGQARRRQSQADLGVELVDRRLGLDARVRLRHPAHVAEVRLAAVAELRVDPCEVDRHVAEGSITPVQGRWSREAGAIPARTRHCHRGTPPARAPRARATGPPTAAREGAGRNAREPGDLPRPHSPIRPRGKGWPHAPSSRRPRARGPGCSSRPPSRSPRRSPSTSGSRAPPARCSRGRSRPTEGRRQRASGRPAPVRRRREPQPEHGDKRRNPTTALIDAAARIGVRSTQWFRRRRRRRPLRQPGRLRRQPERRPVRVLGRRGELPAAAGRQLPGPARHRPECSGPTTSSKPAPPAAERAGRLRVARRSQ